MYTLLNLTSRELVAPTLLVKDTARAIKAGDNDHHNGHCHKPTKNPDKKWLPGNDKIKRNKIKVCKCHSHSSILLQSIRPNSSLEIKSFPIKLFASALQFYILYTTATAGLAFLVRFSLQVLTGWDPLTDPLLVPLGFREGVPLQDDDDPHPPLHARRALPLPHGRDLRRDPGDGSLWCSARLESVFLGCSNILTIGFHSRRPARPASSGGSRNLYSSYPTRPCTPHSSPSPELSLSKLN